MLFLLLFVKNIKRLGCACLLFSYWRSASFILEWITNGRCNMMDYYSLDLSKLEILGWALLFI